MGYARNVSAPRSQLLAVVAAGVVAIATQIAKIAATLRASSTVFTTLHTTAIIASTATTLTLTILATVMPLKGQSSWQLFSFWESRKTKKIHSKN